MNNILKSAIFVLAIALLFFVPMFVWCVATGNGAHDYYTEVLNLPFCVRHVLYAIGM